MALAAARGDRTASRTGARAARTAAGGRRSLAKAAGLARLRDRQRGATGRSRLGPGSRRWRHRSYRRRRQSHQLARRSLDRTSRWVQELLRCRQVARKQARGPMAAARMSPKPRRRLSDSRSPSRSCRLRIVAPRRPDTPVHRRRPRQARALGPSLGRLARSAVRRNGRRTSRTRPGTSRIAGMRSRSRSQLTPRTSRRQQHTPGARSHVASGDWRSSGGFSRRTYGHRPPPSWSSRPRRPTGRHSGRC